MSVRNTNEATKKGCKWVFEIHYRTLQGDMKHYTSKKFRTRREAEDEEKRFLLQHGKLDCYDMTIKDLYNNFVDYQNDKVKMNTLRSYHERFKYLKSIERLRISDFNSTHYSMWRKEMQNYNISDTTRNNTQKLLKILFNYATKWYGINFSQVYPKIVPFKNPNQVDIKEMLFFTYEEFQKFISVEDDILFKVAFEILYYCGTRMGELLALTWKHIDFDKRELKINSNVVKNYLGESKYLVTTPKTRSSVRTIPISEILVNDLKVLKEHQEKVYGFKENWFILGSFEPISPDRIRLRKNKNCELAKVKQIRIHDFRHSCASLLISKGANITLVAKYLGHTKIDETLNTYSHFFKSDLYDIVSQLDNLNKT